VHLSDEEIDLLTERGTVVVHCPLSKLKIASGIAPVPRMRQAGVSVTLGTDGPASGNDLDMWMAIRLAAVVHRGVHGDPTFLPAPEVVKLDFQEPPWHITRPSGSLQVKDTKPRICCLSPILA
jgi:5-methylthioadenosine/S-adenosylhomocysteine deaminase